MEMGSEGKKKWIKYLPLVSEMYKDRGLSTKEISQITGIPLTSLTRLLRNNGIVFRSRKRRDK